MVKNSIIAIIVLMFIIFPCVAEVQTRLTGGVCFDSTEIPGLECIIKRTGEDINNQFWGIGWEVVIDHIGLGGNYYTNFDNDENSQWSVNWYGEVFYVSYHLFGPGNFVDPFVQAGLGSVGSVYIGDLSYVPAYNSRLMISIFPFVSAGAALHFNNFLLGGKINYAPVMEPVPVTNFDLYPLEKIQVLLFAGITFGAH